MSGKGRSISSLDPGLPFLSRIRAPIRKGSLPVSIAKHLLGHCSCTKQPPEESGDAIAEMVSCEVWYIKLIFASSFSLSSLTLCSTMSSLQPVASWTIHNESIQRYSIPRFREMKMASMNVLGNQSIPKKARRSSTFAMVVCCVLTASSQRSLRQA
jgi:hypothetical protein